MERNLISIIVPTYNEVDNIQPIYKAIKNATQKLKYKFEILFVDDGSTDGTPKKLELLAKKDKNVKPVELVRNFGKEIALTAGLHEAKGRAAIMLDADLQHPPKLIPKFIDKWEEGADIVVGVRDRYNAPKVKRAASGIFYKIMSSISDTDFVPHSTDYRLADRQVIEEFKKFTERNRITRGLFDWLGFRREFLTFTAPKRKRGTPSYSVKKLMGLGVDSFVGHSMWPLRMTMYLGAVIMIITLPLAIFIFANQMFFDNMLFGVVFSGSVILIVINLFLTGFVLISLGMMAMYLANIHKEVINRPLYIARIPKKTPNGYAKKRGK